MVEFLKKYKTQIFNVITIFLILEFAIYPGLTTANTLSNILAGIGLLLLIVWGGLALYHYARNVNEPKKEIGETELDYVPKPKPKRKPKAEKAEFPVKPHAKVVRESKTKKTK